VKVCVIGSGGREHALADVLGRDAEVVVTPGNPGIPGSVATPPEELEADLFVVGPEVPLVDGLADRLRASGRRVFGPGADGARLEGSKAWMKELVAAAGVPTARHGTFDSVEPAHAMLDTLTPPFVIKTDGLAAGKGVVVTESLAEARNAVGDYLSGVSFGDAGRTLVIEEGLSGPELSVLAVCDGERAVLLPPAQDFKRIGDGDSGPNTGGMGAYSPVPIVTDDVLSTVMDRFVGPTLAELRRRGIDYRGVLYAGLMFTADGPKLIEYNVRFGDPETQVVVPRLTIRRRARHGHRGRRGLPRGPTHRRRDRRPRRGGGPGRRGGVRGRGGLGPVRSVGDRWRPCARRVRSRGHDRRGPSARLRRARPDLVARDAVPHRHRRRCVSSVVTAEPVSPS